MGRREWRVGVAVGISSAVLFTLLALGATPTKGEHDLSTQVDPPTGGCLEGVEFACRCGSPRCIPRKLVSNGEKDCADGSDEGQWDPSECAIKNETSEDIRFKRSPAREPFAKGDATTKWFTGERGRTRPVGLLSTSLGAFVTSGTTTEYLTKILGSYISGTYARILSTSSKVYHAVETKGGGGDGPRPTGFIASTTSTEVNGYATTLHTTDYYRTYIDGTYAQLVSSSSNVDYPDWYSTQIDSTSRVIEPSRASDADGGVYRTLLPEEVRGSFRKGGGAVAEVGVSLGGAESVGNEVRVTGTHGKFVHTGGRGEEETTYNVFTGSYVKGTKTFLFFFGNTAIDPTRRVAVGHASNEGKTLTVEGGVPGQPMVVDVNSDNVRVVLSPESRGKVTRAGGSLGSAQQRMEGVLVEIEGSESSSVAIDGANRMGTPTIGEMTVTLPQGEETTSSSSSSSSSSGGVEDENEIPRGRKAPPSAEAITLIRPSRSEKISLPTFTVGQEEEEGAGGEEEASTPKAVTFKSSSTSSKSSSSSSNSRPVFNKQSGSSERPPTKSTERIRALGYSGNRGGGGSSSGSSSRSSSSSKRGHRAFPGLFDTMNNAVDSDLQSAASTGRATVTYVGFADFTTTVGNTVIVFMPRTKMVEDVGAPSSAAVTPTATSKVVEPTRFVYTTDEETTTEGKRPLPQEEEAEEHIQFSVSQATPRKVGGGSSISSTTPKEEEEETTTARRVEEEEEEELPRPPEVLKPRVRPSLSSSVLLNSKRASLFSSPRAKFGGGSSKVSTSAPSASASTVILQKEVVNPTGLVTSVVGTLVGKDGRTTQYTSLVFGTFIGKSYAQVIKSTSRVVAPSATPTAKVPTFVRPTRPTPQPSVTYYDFTTVSSGDDLNGAELEETTTQGPLPPNVDKMEVSITSTTEKSTTEKSTTEKATTEKTPTSTWRRPQEEEEVTTRGSVQLEGSEGDAGGEEEEEGTTPREEENEVGRKVKGSPKEQRISDETDDDNDETTILVTRTLPTTLFRTYTYFTTFFIPKDTETITTVASREDTSTFVGHVKKTFTSIVPSGTAVAAVEKPSVAVEASKRRREKGQVIYKTVYTTYTYLTTFFSGKTSSIASREETVSNVVTSTAGGSALKISKVIAPTQEVIEPTSSRSFGSSSKGRSYKTASPRIPQESSSSRAASRQRSSSFLPKKVVDLKDEEEEVSASSEVKYSSVTQTLLKTFKTTYTYFTTFFNEGSTGIRSRTEVITNIVPFVTKTLAPVTSSVAAPPVTSAEEEKKPKLLATSKAFRMSNNNSKRVKETTSYTTFTYLTTLFKGRSTSVKTSLKTSTNVVVGDSTLRSGYVGAIEPTTVVGRKVAPASSSVGVRSSKAFDLRNRVEEEEEEEGTTVVAPSQHDYYELESSEGIGITTNRPEGHVEEEEGDVAPQGGTPVLRTHFTTFTYYTTFYQGGTSSVSSSLETKTQVLTVSGGVEELEEPSSVFENAPLLSTAEDVKVTDPVTYYTTYTYWTTSFKDGNSIVTSREETVTNTVTPSAAAALDDVKVSKVDNNEIVPSEVELTTFYTTYTYFTTSYVGSSTVVNSRLETVTNVVEGTPVEATPRAIGTVRPEGQEVDDVEDGGEKSKSVGKLSTIVATEVGSDRSTTLFSTDVYGTFIDGIYAQVLESTSRVVAPSSTRYVIDPTATPTGVIEVNEGSTVEAEDDRTTFFASTTYGSVIDGRYAHVIESSTSTKGGHGGSTSSPGDEERTGLVRVIKGTLVDDDLRTTLYTSSILGTFIDGQYAQVIESSSRIIVAPTRAVTALSGQRSVEVEGSITERPEEEEDYTTTTTEKGQEEEEVEEQKPSTEEPVAPKVAPKLFGKSRAGGSRLSFTGTSKTFTPAITPFASRSRPASGGFVPRRRTSAAIAASKVAEGEASTSSSSSRGFSGGRKRFQKPGESSENSGNPSTSTPTPALPSSRTRSSSRFAKPPVGANPGGRSSASASISPSSAGGSGGSSSPGGRGRGSVSGRFGSSSIGGRVRGSSSPGGFVKPSSTRGGGGGGAPSSSSRFSRGRGSSAFISPSKTSAAAVASVAATETVGSAGEYEEEEYEYEGSSSASPPTSSTTEPPPTRRLPGGSNRFRLNPKLNLGATSQRTTTARPSTTRGSPLNLRRFSKPTVASRSTTAPPAKEEEEEEEQKSSPAEEYLEEEYVEPSSSTTASPLRTLPGQRKPLAVRTPSAASRPTARTPGGRGQLTSSSTAPPTTTKKTYTPRPRPAGFPRGIAGRTTSTSTTTPSPDEYYEEGEFEYQETRNPPANLTSLLTSTLTLDAAASERKDVAVAAPSEKASLIDTILGSFPFHSLHSEEEEEMEDSPPPQRRRRRRRSPQGGFHRQVTTYDAYSPPLTFTNNHWYGNYGARSARSGGRGNAPSFPTSARQTHSRSSSPSSADYDYEYVYDDGTPARQPPPPTPPPPPPTRQSPSARFRGRINSPPPPPAIAPSPPSRQRQFTLTPNNPTTSRPRTPSRGQQSSFTPRTTPRSFIPSRSRSRNQVTAPPATTSRSSRFRTQNRYTSRNNEPATTPSPRSSRFGATTLTRSRSRGVVDAPKKEVEIFEPTSTITVTQFVPAETTIPFVNGKSTEFKTIVTPSPTLLTLPPHSFSASEYLGKAVLVLHSEMTASPSAGVVALTRFIIRESLTTAVTFTPTTIRGRKTSFSHIIPSTAYSLEPVVTTVTNSVPSLLPPQDNNALTNLLLNQLLSGGLLNPAQLLQLQGVAQGSAQQQVEPQTPVTQFNTKTTSYVTTVTDFTSTIVKITLHGKPLKSTIVETSTHVITATEFITETTVITPTSNPLAVGPTQAPALNPQLIQNLLQQQFAAQLQQQQPVLPQIVPTQAVLPLSIGVTSTSAAVAVEEKKEEGKKEEEPPKKEEEPQSTVITVYVSGKNPGEFSSVLKTVAVGTEEKRRRRSVDVVATKTLTFDVDANARSSSSTLSATFDSDPYFLDYALEDEYEVNDLSGGNDLGGGGVTLEDSYSYSDPFSSLLTSAGDGGASGVPTTHLESSHVLSKA